MKGIGNIYLSWRKGQGQRRYIVGVIKSNVTEGVRFQYLQEGVEKAKADGFLPYTEFPNLNQTYTENVLDVFGQRIIKSDRQDIKTFLDFWEINPKFLNNKYYMLAYTQGFVPTDNFEFLASFNPVEGLCFVTDLANVGSNKIENTAIKVGDKLRFERESDNQFDNKAVKVFKGDLLLGYIKKIHCNVFHKNSSVRPELTIKAIEKNGYVKRIFVKVSF
ncbi:hypothetical protein ABID22_003815 [Pontibacter aydingkolensis]|uniref:HIRAN domain-containing protein n=1 Tax=Pontibacter aydingkolensis TaxID=1911536 RepID=A0ABS7CZ93_9BACT|nr:HIRAN domain-containing protein [Pontibacter aydingkolensis]MBW7469144.1 hypothetical protein [Pontibacter aydingkolensis]